MAQNININWKEIAKMLNVETGVPFKVVIPDYLKKHIEQRSMKGYNFDEIEFCIYWYKKNKMNTPKRCKSCRNANRKSCQEVLN